MSDQSVSVQDAYLKWLSKQVSPAQLSELYTVYDEIDNYCRSRKVLRKPLFETVDLKTLAAVRDTIEVNRIFRLTHKRSLSKMSSAIRFYITYCKEHGATAVHPAQRVNRGELEKTPDPKKTVVHTATPAMQQKGGMERENEYSTGAATSLEIQVREMLRRECTNNRYGTTVTYLSSQIHGVRPDDIKRILDQAAWAKVELGRYHYIEPTASPMIAEKGAAQIAMPKQGKQKVDFEHLVTLAFSKPTRATYFGEALFIKPSWTDVYVKLVSALNDDYPGIVPQGKSFTGSGRIDFGNQDLAKSMVAPKEIATPGLFLETNLSATDVVKKIKSLLDICHVDYENVVIEYETTGKVSLEKKANHETQRQPQMDRSEVLSISSEVKPAAKALPDPIPADWIKFEYVNARAFVDTFPTYVCIDGELLQGNNWARIVVALTEKGLRDKPALAQSLCSNSVISRSGHNPFFLTEKPKNLNASQLSNGYWVNLNMEIPRLMMVIHGLCCQFEYEANQVIIYGALKAIPRSRETLPVRDPSTKPSPEIEATKRDTGKLSPLTQKALENAVLDADIEGITIDALASKLSASVLATRKAVECTPSIMDIGGRLIHEDSLIDWDEAQEKLDELLTKLMDKNDGYVSAPQLYDYARVEMQMFLNDHDLDKQESVYHLARYLFEKKGYHGKKYAFTGGGMHISRQENEVNTIFDLAKKYSSEHEGFFCPADLGDYFIRTGSSNGTNLYLHMRINREPAFFFYDEEHVMAADFMGIDEAWLTQVNEALQRLFDDAGDHIMLRSIQPSWYRLLPKLPGGRDWTALLLQSILVFYGDGFGCRTIGAANARGTSSLQAVLVTDESEIQDFRDAVIAALVDNGIEQREYFRDQLQQQLAELGLIGVNQLMGDGLSQSLSGDSRFVWSADGKRVTIKI